jgi:hypothetical protein
MATLCEHAWLFTCLVSHSAHITAHERFMHFAGQPNARLSNDQSIYEAPEGEGSRSLLITLCSPLRELA